MTRLAFEHDAINLAQGFPDFPAPAFVKRAAIEAIEADVNQYANHLGRPAPARGHCGEGGAPLRARHRPRARGDGHVRSDRGDDGDDARLRGAGRRGHRLRAVLRELRARCGHERGDAQVRDATRARLRVRPGRAAGGIRAADEGDHRELAQQPERQGVRPRGAGADRGALPGVRLPLLHGRNLRAHPLRRARAPADGDAPGDVRAHSDHQRALEDVQHHRLAAGLRGRAAAI